MGNRMTVKDVEAREKDLCHRARKVDDELFSKFRAEILRPILERVKEILKNNLTNQNK